MTILDVVPHRVLKRLPSFNHGFGESPSNKGECTVYQGFGTPVPHEGTPNLG
jgi:hypothetical protein